MSIENVALVGAFRLRRRAEQKNLAQVAARRVQPTAGCRGEGGNLARAGPDKIGKIADAVDRENVAAIAGAGDETSMLIEAQRIDQIFARTPKLFRGSVGSDAI